MRNSLRRLALFILAAASLAARAELSAYEFKVDSERTGTQHRVVARNSGILPVTVTIQIVSGENVGTDRSWPAALTVGPRQSLTVGHLYPARQGERFSFRLRNTWMLGDLNAKHAADTRYRLPFADGGQYVISQAFGGPLTTHSKPEDQHAVDFTMPEGTLVVAARAGIVARVESRYSKGGKDPELLGKSNEVLILHDDGTIAHYAHLGLGRQLVKAGQRVEEGNAIGYSGSTGFSSGPHLHFAVTRAILKPDNMPSAEAVPIQFYAFDPPQAFSPRAGMMVLAEYGQQDAARRKHSAQASSISVAVHESGPKESVATSAGMPEPEMLQVSLDLTPLVKLKSALDEWAGSPVKGWIILVAPVLLMLFYGLAPAKAEPLQEKMEPRDSGPPAV